MSTIQGCEIQLTCEGGNQSFVSLGNAVVLNALKLDLIEDLVDYRAGG